MVKYHINFLKPIFYSILLFVCNNLHAQNLDRTYLLQEVKKRWTTKSCYGGRWDTVELSVLNRCNAYRIDGKFFDSVSVDPVLGKLKKSDVMAIGIMFKMDFHTRKPYDWLIGFNTKAKQSKRDKKDVYESAISELITDHYSYKDTGRLSNAKDVALIINDEIIPPQKARAKLFSLDFKDIENIDACGVGYEHPIYGENSKHGQVFIWTKQRK